MNTSIILQNNVLKTQQLKFSRKYSGKRDAKFSMRTNFMKTEKNNGSTLDKIPKVLLVEDTPLIQYIHTQYLKKLGCEVDLAKTGNEAIEMFNDNYDLIILDIGLPDITGIEVAKKIRNTHHKNHVPIIAITGYGSNYKNECLEAGIDDVFAKPIKLDELDKILKRWLTKQLNTESAIDINTLTKRKILINR